MMDGVVSGRVLRALFGGVIFNWTLPVRVDVAVSGRVPRALVEGVVFNSTLPP